MNTLPSLIDRFHIKHRLMQDPSGQILIAWDTANQSDVFIRTAPDRLKSIPELSTWFQKEFDRACRVQHPNLSKVIEAPTGSEVGPYLVSERPAGVSLRGLVPREIPLSAALRILIHSSHGLIAAVNAGVLPLHLFPDQILVTPAGAVKVAIFGGHDQVEQGEGSLCTMFASRAFELISGRLMDGPEADGIDLSALPSGAAHSLDPSMVVIFQRAFAKDRNARFSSLRLFMDMLIAAAPMTEDQRLELLELMASDAPLAEDPVIAAAVPPEAQWEEVFPQKDPATAPSGENAPSPARGSRRGMAITAAVVLVAALGVGGGVVLRRPAPITIQVNPPGAEVRVDGRMLGKAPLGPTRDIKPGMVVQAESNGYLPTRYTVKDGDSFLNLKLDLIPPPPPEPKVPDTPEPVAEPSPDPVPSSKAPKPKAKPKPAPAPKEKKRDVFDQIRKQMQGIGG